MHNPESVLEKETHKIRFGVTNGSPNLGQTTIPCDNQQKKNKNKK